MEDSQEGRKARLRIYVEDAEERLTPVHPADMPALFEEKPEEAAELLKGALEKARTTG